MITAAAGAKADANGAAAANGTAKPHSSIPGFKALDVDTVRDYIAERQALSERVGPSDSRADWKASHIACTPFFNPCCSILLSSPCFGQDPQHCIRQGLRAGITETW